MSHRFFGTGQGKQNRYLVILTLKSGVLDSVLLCLPERVSYVVFTLRSKDTNKFRLQFLFTLFAKIVELVVKLTAVFAQQ